MLHFLAIEARLHLLICYLSLLKTINSSHFPNEVALITAHVNSGAHINKRASMWNFVTWSKKCKCLMLFQLSNKLVVNLLVLRQFEENKLCVLPMKGPFWILKYLLKIKICN
ncbi:hypothetical protein QQ045_007987 [Rhodiola kirilowii]